MHVTHLSPKGIADVYAFIRANSTIVSANPVFWHVTQQQEIPLDAVPNAAALVVERMAEPFHVVISGLRFQDTIVPDLGMFIFQDQIAFDYRMGQEWGEAQVMALFELLWQICNIDLQAKIGLEEGVNPEVKRRFQDAWSTSLLRNRKEKMRSGSKFGKKWLLTKSKNPSHGLTETHWTMAVRLHSTLIPCPPHCSSDSSSSYRI